MTRILLINPNTSAATTAMMLAIARAASPPGITIAGATATCGEPMIVDPEALARAGAGVVAMGLQHAGSVDGVIVGAFGDPGLAELRARLAIPVTGIAEAALAEAAAAGRRFGVATVTPRLRPAIDAAVAALGLLPGYTGTRLTGGDPQRLAADPTRLVAALARAVERCVQDGAEVVVIGGGPLGDAATALAGRCAVPVLSPIAAAVRRLLPLIGAA